MIVIKSKYKIVPLMKLYEWSGDTMDENKRNTIEKRMIGYNNFKCIADKCKFTCCSGWDINIDINTYEKWNKEKNKCKDMLNKLKFIDNDYIIVNKKTSDTCPFLDNKGLCDIVKSNGDEYLSLTCQRFPRIENTFEGIKELTLSCSCPEVVDIIEKVEEEIILVNCNNNADDIDLPIEIKIRDTIIKIIKEENLNIESKLLISYTMLLNILDNEELTEEVVLNELEKYNNIILQETLQNKSDYNKTFRTINNLFLDTIENYKNVPVLKSPLNDISQISMKIYRGQIKTSELIELWYEFIDYFNKYNKLIEKLIITKVLGNCLNEDIEEVAINLELIILEYVLLRYSVFLKVFLGDKENLLQNIKDYVVVFSRIIGNNSDAVVEFIEEQYGDILFTVEYLQKFILCDS